MSFTPGHTAADCTYCTVYTTRILLPTAYRYQYLSYVFYCNPLAERIIIRNLKELLQCVQYKRIQKPVLQCTNVFFFLRFHLISISEGYNGKATKQPIHRLNVEKKKKRIKSHQYIKKDELPEAWNQLPHCDPYSYRLDFFGDQKHNVAERCNSKMASALNAALLFANNASLESVSTVDDGGTSFSSSTPLNSTASYNAYSSVSSWLISRSRIFLYLCSPYEERFQFQHQIPDYQTEVSDLRVYWL